MLASKQSLNKRAFSLVELLAGIAIIAAILAAVVPMVGSYIDEARKVADHQTLTVLNDALTRYKTQGGSLEALTAGANMSNVLTALQAPVSWAGVTHQFLKGDDNYVAASISAIGNGAQFRFSQYGSYADGTIYGSNILASYANNGYDVGDEKAFEQWLTDAFSATESTNYIALENPDTTDHAEIGMRVAKSGDKVRVWWGDGTTNELTPDTGSVTYTYKNYGSNQNRTIVIVGNINSLTGHNTDGRADWGGDITTCKSITYFSVGGANTLYGDVSLLNPNITDLAIWGSNTLTGDLSNLKSLQRIALGGVSSVSGDLTDINDLYYIGIGGVNTIGGDVSDCLNLTRLNVTSNHSTINSSIVGMTNLDYLQMNADSCSFIAPADWNPFTRLGRVVLKDLSTEEVDAVLVAMDANKDEPKGSPDKLIILTRNCRVPSATGLAAKASLEAAGWTVNTN